MIIGDLESRLDCALAKAESDDFGGIEVIYGDFDDVFGGDCGTMGCVTYQHQSPKVL